MRRFPILAAAAAALALALPATSSATFAGANGTIFFQGPQSGTSGPADVFAISPLGGEAFDLTKENGFSEERPAASADGRVVFQSFRDEGWNVFKMNADGSGIVDLTKTKHPVENFEPTWSPDGSEVVFQRSDASGQDLWRVDADGGNPENLTETPGVQESGAEFSPDGTRIVYVGTGPKPCCDPEYNNDIWVMNADGSDQTQLTKTDFPRQNLSPTWSPDGTKIAFSTVASEDGSDGFHTMDADGNNQVRPLPGGSPVPALNLSWSPDGTRIVFQPLSGGLQTMNPDGTGISPLVSNTGAAYPSWAPTTSGGSSGGGTPTPTLPKSTPPSNKIAFGKVKLNKKKGTATLTVKVLAPGLLVLKGKGLKKATKTVAAPGKATLPVKATGKALKKLAANGAVVVKAKVTFTPRGGSPNTQTKRLTLKKQL
jgi:Tol biopolymer transport system component